MGLVTLNQRRPFLGKVGHEGLRKYSPRRHFTPDHEAKAVRPIQVTRILKFLVFARKVKAQREGQLNILF